ncbi:MAG: hypothetical protein WBZ37_12065 [Mycobacterium sp.]
MLLTLAVLGFAGFCALMFLPWVLLIAFAVGGWLVNGIDRYPLVGVPVVVVVRPPPYGWAPESARIRGNPLIPSRHIACFAMAGLKSGARRGVCYDQSSEGRP